MCSVPVHGGGREEAACKIPESHKSGDKLLKHKERKEVSIPLLFSVPSFKGNSFYLICLFRDKLPYESGLSSPTWENGER